MWRAVRKIPETKVETGKTKKGKKEKESG